MKRSNHKTINIGAVLAVAALALGWATTAAADPVLDCQVAKLKAAGERAECLADERKEELKGDTPDFQKCEDNFDTAIAAAGTDCRYIDNGDGTVSDLNTLLIWEKKTDDGSVHDADNTYAWSATSGGTAPDGTAFTDFLGKLNNCTSGDGATVEGGFTGRCDWRLPTIAELRTILLALFPCSTSPCVDPIFNNGTDSFTAAARYWSSTTSVVFSGMPAWIVDFSNGIVGFVNKFGVAHGRGVRGGR